MPGTGHSARYKGSISNRVKKSPFQQLAEWNAQLLGADGAVPSIVGGGGLEFKKLDASDIEGVLHNPTKVNLQFIAPAGIESPGDMKISVTGILTLDGGSAAGDGVIVGSGGGRVGMYGVTPTLRGTALNLTEAFHTSVASTPVNIDDTWRGSAGNTYTIGKIVDALMKIGILT